MSIHVRRPSPAALDQLRDAGRTDSLTYEPVGISALQDAPPGYRLHRWSRSLGSGDLVFERARNALHSWKVQSGSGLIVRADGPPTVGSVVAIAAPLPIVGYIDVVCRVVEVIELPDRSAFTYGTLSVHPESGEESFTVVRAPDGTVTFEIAAASRPRHLAARLAPPVARFLQRAATKRYFEAMQAAVDN
jgi:uncharacterized protein (UPF0548 family)